MISKIAQSRRGQRIGDVRNGEWKPGNEWGCERLRKKREREGKTEVSLALILSQLFLPYQASPDMGEKHVPRMHCGSCPSAWNEPLTPSYQLRGRLPVPVAVQLWIQGKICVQSSADRKTQTYTNKHTYAPDSAIGNQKWSPGHITVCIFRLSWQFRLQDTHKQNVHICINVTQIQGHTHTYLQRVYTNMQPKHKDDVLLCVNHW